LKGADGIRIGVIVPCRNEARVIARRLANLNLSRLPDGVARPHLVVVDDGSSDETRALALAGCEEMSGWSTEVIANLHAKGKNGAVRTGLDHLGSLVDVVVLTDADVITNAEALSAIAAAFCAEPELGMATGVQRLHGSLPVDPRDLDGEDAMGLYDHWTRSVRRYESRKGRLFSVHGQLLAWRADQGLTPRALAADDLELMLELRRSHPERTVRMIEGAVFHEERSPDRADQDLRRARAYLQALPMMKASGLGSQAWFYSRVPALAPVIAVLVLSIAALSVGVVGGAVMLSLFVAALALMTLHPATKRLLGLLLVIERARRAERAESLSTSWETARV
jgi:glycosyltransferase involved in cell wall biosynthesis